MTRDTDGSWGEAQVHLLAQPMSAALRDWIASDTPYRAAYVSPLQGAKTYTKIAQSWRGLRAENPFVWGAATETELCLEWLRREFGPAAA